MKKSLLVLIPAILMGMVACGPTATSTSSSSSNPGTSSTSKPGSTSSTSSSKEEKKLTVYFFTSYDYFDKENAYSKVEVSYGSSLTNPGIPSCPNEAYPTFLGWSEHPVVDDTRYIIDFSTYKVTTDTKIKELALYGIWVAE